MCNVDSFANTYISGVNNFVGGGVGENSLGVDSSLVGEGGEPSNVIVEGDIDLDAVGDHVLNGLELVKVVLALDVVAIGNDHSCHQATERSDSVPLTDSDNRGVDVGSTGLEGAVSVRNGASGVVVEMALDVAADDTAESPDEVVDLSW